MVSKTRIERISDRILEELSEMLLQEVADPRLLGVSVTGVKVDRELTFADIYVSALEGSERAPEILAAFEHAQGFLRYQLSQRVELRTFPRLRFHWDPTFERAERIEHLIAALHQEEQVNSTEKPAVKEDDTHAEETA